MFSKRLMPSQASAGGSRCAVSAAKYAQTDGDSAASRANSCIRDHVVCAAELERNEAVNHVAASRTDVSAASVRP